MDTIEQENHVVVELLYSVIPNDDVKYAQSEESKIYRRDGFDIIAHNRQIVLKFHDGYPDEVSAQEAIRKFIGEWEHRSDMDTVHGAFRLQYNGANVVNRTPYGDQHVPTFKTVFTIRQTLGTLKFPAILNYPIPPEEITIDSEDFLLSMMVHAYGKYQADRTNITTVAYFCLTCLMDIAQNDKIRAASKAYGISAKKLRRVGELSSTKGGQYSARKADATRHELNEEEIRFLEDMMKLMIQRRGEYALNYA